MSRDTFFKHTSPLSICITQSERPVQKCGGGSGIKTNPRRARHPLCFSDAIRRRLRSLFLCCSRRSIIKIVLAFSGAIRFSAWGAIKFALPRRKTIDSCLLRGAPSLSFTRLPFNREKQQSYHLVRWSQVYVVRILKGDRNETVKKQTSHIKEKSIRVLQ